MSTDPGIYNKFAGFFQKQIICIYSLVHKIVILENLPSRRTPDSEFNDEKLKES